MGGKPKVGWAAYCRNRRAGLVMPDARERHGAYGTPEYHAFSSAKGRCINKKDKRYSSYGGRGIKFLYTGFAQFIMDVGPRPSPLHSLDRRENDGHYQPGNCRWATKKEQAANRRARKTLQSFTTEEILSELKRRTCGGPSKD